MTAKIISSGQIITFYSYKGGTGRSMALANIACLLAQDWANQEGVLMIDWDLEAPDLHQFFRGRFDNSEDKRGNLPSGQLGLIDLFCEIKIRLEKSNYEADIPETFFDNLAIAKYTAKLKLPFLSLMPAGRFDDRLYASRVNSFNWEEFFDEYPSAITQFANYLRKKFRYVLIDSRTGYTDISGICTSLMPEKLVVVFTPNRQSLTGVIDLVRKSTEYRKQSDDLRKLVVFPLPSRIEPAEPSLRKDWRFGNLNSSGGILIITTTKVEAQAVLNVFSQASGKPWKRISMGNKTYYDLGLFGDSNIIMAQSELGIAAQGSTIRNAIDDVKPTAVIMVGIAFGTDSRKQKLGDILVSKQIQTYELQKVTKTKIVPRGESVTASIDLLDKFRSGDLDWDGPTVHFGQILSGEKLITSQEFRNELLNLEPEAIGGEMEGAGLIFAAIDAGVDWILVKGISDWATEGKSDEFQPGAAENAARFVLHVLKLGGWSQPKRLLDGYQPEFESVFKEVYHLDRCNLTKYFDDVQIQHVPRYAYGEEIAVLEESGTDRLSLARSFENFTQMLTKLDGPWEDLKVTQEKEQIEGAAEEALQDALRFFSTEKRTVYGTLQQLDSDTGELVDLASVGYKGGGKDIRAKLGEGITGRVAQTGEALLIGDVTDTKWKKVYTDVMASNMRSELAVPLMREGELWGVLNIESPTPNAFDENDQRLLEAIAGQIMISLRNAEAQTKNKLADPLREDQWELLKLRAEGRSISEISKLLGYSSSTIRTKLSRIYETISQKNSVDAIRWFEQNVTKYGRDSLPE